MRVAVVHEWLVLKAGSEAVLEQILQLYPQADVFTLVDFMPAEDKKALTAASFHTSFIQKLPFARTRYRSYLPLMPLAIEQFDLSGYDLVISSSHAVAKGVLTGPDQVHVSYVHTPIRYAWDLQHSYLKEAGLAKGFKSLLSRLILHYIRLWDYRTANGVDAFVANSGFIARRIYKVYRREAEVIYPPVNLQAFALHEQKEDFYLTVSRFVPYKKIPLIAKAFAQMPDKKLVIIGDGPEAQAVRAAAGPNVTILGHQPRDVVIDYMQRAKAFVFMAEEDFGIVPVEAQACGTPVIAYGKGGATETVLDGQTGVLFPAQTETDLQQAVARFELLAPSLNPRTIRENAQRFGIEQFRARFKSFVDATLAARKP